MSSVLTADVYYSDAQCSSQVVRIGYTNNNNNNATDCNPAQLRTNGCVKSTISASYYVAACALPDVIAFSDNYFPATTATFVALDMAGIGCGGGVTGGYQMPLGTCVQLPYAGSNTNQVVVQSSMATIDAASGNVFWSQFADTQCKSVTATTRAGNANSAHPFCDSTSKRSFQLTNYSPQLLTRTTVFADAECTLLAVVVYSITGQQCVPSSSCVDGLVTSCDSTEYDLDAQSAKLFKSAPYFIYQPYFDTACVNPKPAQSILFGVCYPTAPLGVVSSNNNQNNSITTSQIGTLSPDGSTISITYYSAAECAGAASARDDFPVTGACTPTGSVSYKNVIAVLPSNAVTPGNSTSKGNSSSSSSNVGGIIGGVIGGVALLAAIGGLLVYCLRYRAQKKPNVFQDSSMSLTQRDGTLPNGSIRPSINNVPASAVPGPTDGQTLHSRDTNDVREWIVSGAPSSRDQPGIHDRARDEKCRPTHNLFTDMTEVMGTTSNAALNAPQVKEREAEMERRRGLLDAPENVNPDDKEYAMFGQLLLPAIPSQWSVADVVDWVSSKEGTPQILQYIQTEEIDGRALLLMSVEQFNFPTIGRRLRFADELAEMRLLNERKLHAVAMNIPPPAYPPAYPSSNYSPSYPFR